MTWRGLCLMVSGLLACASAVQAEHKVAIPPSAVPLKFESTPLPDFSYTCDDEGTCHLADFMRRAKVCALLVLKDNRPLFHYNPDPYTCRDGDGPPERDSDRKRYGIASVTKSITSTLLGFALVRGSGELDVAKLQQPISTFLPGLGAEQSRGAYAGVPAERVLLMRSGAKYDEYGADARHLRAQVFGTEENSALDFLRKLRRARSSGKPIEPAAGEFNYAGADTQAIGLLVEHLAGTRLHGYLWSKLWNPLGMAGPTKWTLDWQHSPSAYCCLSMTAPDLLRFGKFVLERGLGRERTDKPREQLLPASWFDVATKSVNPEDEVIPEGNPSFNEECGKIAPTRYRYQWWLFDGRSDFTAIGINGQFVHVYPDENLVIVQISAWGNWSDALECESLTAHKAISEMLRN